MRNLVFCLFVVFFGTSSLSQTQANISTISSLQFPFKLSIKSIEESTNQSIKGVIYKDSLYTNMDNDQMKCTVWKDGLIKLSPVKNSVLRVDVPLKAWIEKGIGALGVYTYKSTEFRLTMSFHLVYNITPEWKLITKTLKNGYVWNQKPNLSFAALDVPITPIVEKILDSKQGEYAALIDAQIAKNINLKAQMIEVWNTLKVPQKISDEYNTWLAVIPNRIEAQLFTQDATHIKSAFKVYVQMLSSIGSDSALRTPSVRDIPHLVYRNFSTDSFQLFTFITIPYSEATAIANKKFVNQDFSFNDGKYNVTITNINIYSSENKLLIETDMIGSFKGKVFIRGDIYYDATRRVIKMRNLEFDMKTKNILHKAATWIFNGKIEKNLEENFEMPMAELLDYSLHSTNQALNRTQNGFKMIGKTWHMSPEQITCNPTSMLVTLLALGQLALER